jgi:hypothetical protein
MKRVHLDDPSAAAGAGRIAIAQSLRAGMASRLITPLAHNGKSRWDTALEVDLWDRMLDHSPRGDAPVRGNLHRNFGQHRTAYQNVSY